MRELIVLATLGLLMLSSSMSCKKYLDKKPNSAIATPSTLADLQGILDYSLSMNLSATPAVQEVSADDFFYLAPAAGTYPEEAQQVYSWRFFDYSYPNDWSVGYVPIYNANICLEYLNNINRTVQNGLDWDNVRGSALFFRAYYFLQLSWSFSKAYDEATASNDLGIVLRLSSDFNVPSVRSSVKDCYNQVISDAMESVKYLPDISKHPLRPSKAAAYGLLARAYLTMRQYDSAFKYADACLSIKNDLLDYKPLNVGPTVAPFNSNTKEIIFYTTMNSKYTFFARPAGLIDSTLYSTFEATDKRKSLFFRTNTGAAIRYFGFKGNYTGSAAVFFSGIATDEMYLVRAECYARKNDKDNALSDLNKLLVNRYDASFSPVTALNSQEALSRILLERRKELIFRGLRWPDIKRFNKEGANISNKRFIGTNEYNLAPNSNYFALPLPSDIINLTGMPQNPK